MAPVDFATATSVVTPLPSWERVPEGRVRGPFAASRTPHPALRATFSHKGRREEVEALYGTA